MKKIFSIVLALILLISVLTMSSCYSSSNVVYDIENDNSAYIYKADLTPVPGYDYLYYSINTHTVYYLGFESKWNSWMCPYISNGHYCEYVNGEIVEIES